MTPTQTKPSPAVTSSSPPTNEPNRDALAEIGRKHGVLIEPGQPLVASDFESAIRYRGESERVERLKTLLQAWREQQSEERSLRRTYAKWLLLVLVAEILAIFLAFFLVGLAVIKVEAWAAEVFLVSALVQSTSLVVVVVRYLFPDRGNEALRLIEAVEGARQLPR